MADHGRKPPAPSSAVFRRRRIVFLVVTGVVVGMAFWPLNTWLSAGSGTPSEQASSDSAQESGGSEAAGGTGGSADTGDSGGAGKGKRGEQAAAEKTAGKQQAAGNGRPTGGDAGAGSSGRPEPKKKRQRPRVPACQGDALRVSATVDRENAPAGRPLDFRLRVRNGGDDPCRIPADPGQVRVAVLHGSERVLDTDRCSLPIEAEPSRVKPGKVGTVTVRWNGRRTAGECSASAPRAEPGAYSVQASVRDAFSAPATFRLR